MGFSFKRFPGVLSTTEHSLTNDNDRGIHSQRLHRRCILDKPLNEVKKLHLIRFADNKKPAIYAAN